MVVTALLRMRREEMAGSRAMDPAEISRALTPLPGHERYVRRRFWRKVLRTLGRVPFIDQAIAAYYAAIDPATPRYAKGMLMAALAYFILPADTIPDVLAVLGFSDDAAVLFMAVKTLSAHIKPEHVQHARAFLEEQA
jgi:uncharacterized membrane protein YkvA (DUF1232 family)